MRRISHFLTNLALSTLMVAVSFGIYAGDSTSSDYRPSIEPYHVTDKDSDDYNKPHVYLFNDGSLPNTRLWTSDDTGENGKDIELYVPYCSDKKCVKNSLMTYVPYAGEKVASMLKFNFKIINNDSDEDFHIYAAVEDNSNSTLRWKIIYKTGVRLPLNATVDKYTIDDFSVAAINGGIASTTYYKVYFFTEKFNYKSVGNFIDSGSLPENGVYFKVNVSTGRPEGENVRLISASKGDARSELRFDSGASDEEFRAIVFNGSEVFGGYFYGNYRDINNFSACALDDDQKLLVRELSNGTTYNLSVACMDKFYFYTEKSNEIAVTPEAIETFAKKNACYLLSAGFGEEHFVLSFFRNFRDNVLQKSVVGRIFVSWYYYTAPNFVEFIASTPIVAWIIRVLAYLAYAVINFWKLIFIPPPVIYAILFVRKKIKK